MRLLDVKLQCGLWIPAILLAAMLAPGLVAQAPGDNVIINLIRVQPAAQQTPPAGGRRGPGPAGTAQVPSGGVRGGIVGPDNLQPGGAWWTNPALRAQLGLTDDQIKRIESTNEQFQRVLAQNRADLEREEAALSRMLETEPMEPVAAISAQIDRVVQARGEAERTNSRMALEIRQILTRAQWVQVQGQGLQPLGLGTGQRGRGGARRGGAPPSAAPQNP